MTTEHETDIATLEQEESKIALAALSLDGEWKAIFTCPAQESPL